MKYDKLINEIDERIDKNIERRFDVTSNVLNKDAFYNNINLLDKIKTVLVEADKNYDRGAEDAWGLARKFFGSTAKGAYSASEFYKVFVNHGMASMMDNHTYKEALAKVEAYEQKKKEEAEKPVIGDVVLCDSGVIEFKGIVIGESDFSYEVLTTDDPLSQLINKDTWTLTKTGKHFDIQGMLDEIKTED